VKQRVQPTRWSAAALLGIGLLAAPAAGEEVLILGEESGADTAPYKFLPSLARGDRETLWAITDPGNVHSFETYVRFDLPPALLSGELLVEEAVFSIFFSIDSVSFGDGTDEPGVLECRPVLEAWDEMAMTWNNRPAFGPAVDAITGITEVGPLSCDVTELVRDWASGAAPNHGIALTNPTGALLGFFSFESDEDPDLEPQLLVVAVPEPGARAGALAAGAALGSLALWRRRHPRENGPGPDLLP